MYGSQESIKKQRRSAENVWLSDGIKAGPVRLGPLSPQECLREQNCFSETTPTGVAVAGTPRCSGRVSQPPKALADYVLY